MKVTGGESNLLGGVSQQPVDRRLRGSVSEQVNCLTSVLKGIERRPPMEFTPVTIPAELYEHNVWLDFVLGDITYMLRVQYTRDSSTELQMDMYQLDGPTVSITIDPLVIPYITSQEPEQINITATTDGIYILNPTQVTSMSTMETLPPYGAYIHMTGTNYGRDYEILINGVVKASVTIPADTTGLEPSEIQSESIMSQLDVDFTDATYTTSVSGSTMFITPYDIYSYMNLEVYDGDNNNYLRLAQRVIPSVDKLPNAAVQDSILTVRPNQGGKESEYYLKYVDKQTLYDNELGVEAPEQPVVIEREFEFQARVSASYFGYQGKSNRGYATTLNDVWDTGSFETSPFGDADFLGGTVTDFFVSTSSDDDIYPSVYQDQVITLKHTGTSGTLPQKIELEFYGKKYRLIKQDATTYATEGDNLPGGPYSHFKKVDEGYYAGSTVSIKLRNTIAPDLDNMFPGGIWIETLQPGLTYKINAATMPVKVTLEEAFNTWDAARVVWEERRVGNEENNKTPSFIGNKINSMAFVQSRLCLLTDHSVIFSRVDEENDFWRRSATTVTASDRIDIESRLLDTGAFRTITAHDKDIVIFGDDEQWVIPIVNGLASSSISLQLASRYANDAQVEPLTLGASLAYPVWDGTYTQMREFYTRDDTGSNDSEDLTSIIPTYIRGRVKQMVSTTLNNLLVIQTDEPNKLYIMQWHVQNGAKVMQSWHTWELPETPEHMLFYNGTLIVIVAIGVTPGYYSLNPVFSTYTGLPHEVHLDHRLEVVMSDNNEINLLDDHAYTEDTTLVVGSPDSNYPGMAIPFTISGNTITVDDRLGTVLSGTWLIGNTYSSCITLSELVYRDDQDRYDSSRTLRLNNIKVRHNNSGPYTVNITRSWGDYFSETFSQDLSRSVAAAQLGTSLINSGELPVVIRERSEYVTIEVDANGHLPFNLTGYDWQGQLNGSGQRRYF